MSDSHSHRELPTAESLPDHLFRLALPVLGEQILVFGIDLFDVYLAGQLGAAETSAIGLASYVVWMASLIFGLVRTGVAALVARSWGAGDRISARQITARGLFLGFFLSLIVWRLLQPLAPLFAGSLTMEGNAQAVAVDFIRWAALGQLFSGATLIGTAALRGTGDMRTPLAILAVTNVVNVIASTACVYGWGPMAPMGVTGIVLGTVTAQATGMVLMLLALCSGVTRLPLMWSEVRFHRETAGRILRVGGPTALDGLLKFSGHFLFLMVIARLSAEGFNQAIFSAHIVGVRIEALSYLPAEAWGIASASLAGRLLGATSPDVALRTGHMAVRQFVWYPVAMSFAFFAFAPQIYHAMNEDPAVAAAGVSAFRLMALYQVPNACLIIYVYTLIGAGDTRFPMWCSLCCSLGVRVPVAYFCGVVLEGGLFGAWIGMGIDNIIRSAVISWRYAAGNWTRTNV